MKALINSNEVEVYNNNEDEAEKIPFFGNVIGTKYHT